MWQPTEKMQKWRKLAEYWSRPTKCPAALILAVIQQESGGNPKATRFEPEYLKRYAKRCKEIADAGDISEQEVAISYGLMQLMLPLAWGYMSPEQKQDGCGGIMTCLNPAQNIRFGAAHLGNLMKKAAPNGAPLDMAIVRTVAGKYNGGGSDSAYARNVSALYVRYDKWLRGVE